MIRIFQTGDNHIGKKYDRYPVARQRLIQSRLDGIRRMVQEANARECDFFVITGDLFDNTYAIAKKDVKAVADALTEFTGSVLLLPGNHDYYTGEEQVWKDFWQALALTDHNITFLNEFREYHFDIRGEEVVVYPAFCQSKHSDKNNLGWLKERQFLNNQTYRIGIAHGAIRGITPDMKNQYFLMSEKELENIPMDVWLIGHTHISYPGEITEQMKSTKKKIFNAGTHEQTDLACNTEGCCFIMELEKNSEDGEMEIRVGKYLSGGVRFYDRDIKIPAGSHMDHILRDTLQKEIETMDRNAILRFTIRGAVTKEEYEDRQTIYQQLMEQFLDYEIVDEELSELITEDMIKEEFPEMSFSAAFLTELLGDEKEVQMAYELLKECEI